MLTVLVADKIAEAGVAILDKTPGVSYEVKHGISPAELAECIGRYDGILIRSAVKITRETLATPGNLMAVARAGVGVDNIDLDAATAAGVLVLNTPDANTISTAEHTLAMMLSMYRCLPDAHAHVRSGKWDRAGYKGQQLCGQTLGIIGLGRIGQAVALRALAFGMTVVAYDPFVKQSTSLNGEVTMTGDLDELLSRVDCVTIHAMLTEETRHMIGKPQLSMMKKGARLVNCARGPLIDENALADALNSGHLGGAAIDVYENEPPSGSPLLDAKNIVLAPHLAASTDQAQQQAGVDAVESLLAYLLRGEIRSAVNVTGMPRAMPPRARAFVDLSSRMGTILSPWCASGVEHVRVTVYSEALSEFAGTFASQLVASVLSPHLQERVNLVNAKEHVRQRGIRVDHVSHSLTPNQMETVHVSVETGSQKHEIEGTVWGDGRPRILSIDGYRMELVPAGAMALIYNDDTPGVIGLVGNTLGDAGINIADMVLGRRGGRALMVLKLDEPMSQEVRDTLDSLAPVQAIRRLELPPLASRNVDA